MTEPISIRTPSVIIEYDCCGERKTKLFDDPFKARRFYSLKSKANKSPKVRKPE